MATRSLAFVSTPEGGTKIIRCSALDISQAAEDVIAREDSETILFGVLDREDLDELIKEVQTFEAPPPGFQKFLVLFYSHGQLYSRVSSARHRDRAVEIAAWQNQEDGVSFSHIVAVFTLQVLHEIASKVARKPIPEW